MSTLSTGAQLASRTVNEVARCDTELIARVLPDRGVARGLPRQP